MEGSNPQTLPWWFLTPLCHLNRLASWRARTLKHSHGFLTPLCHLNRLASWRARTLKHSHGFLTPLCHLNRLPSWRIRTLKHIHGLIGKRLLTPLCHLNHLASWRARTLKHIHRLTEFKSHLFYWQNHSPMKEGRKPQYPRKTPGDKLQKMPHTKPQRFKPQARLEPTQ